MSVMYKSEDNRSLNADHNGDYLLFPFLLFSGSDPLSPPYFMSGKCLELHLRVSCQGEKRVMFVFFPCLCCMKQA